MQSIKLNLNITRAKWTSPAKVYAMHFNPVTVSTIWTKVCDIVLLPAGLLAAGLLADKLSRPRPSVSTSSPQVAVQSRNLKFANAKHDVDCRCAFFLYKLRRRQIFPKGTAPWQPRSQTSTLMKVVATSLLLEGPSASAHLLLVSCANCPLSVLSGNYTLLLYSLTISFIIKHRVSNERIEMKFWLQSFAHGLARTHDSGCGHWKQGVGPVRVKYWAGKSESTGWNCT